MKNNQYEILVKTFSEEYLEKLYYYCLKKTGSTAEAEELSSDVTLNILTALEKGTVPASFSGWVWQIAHNRYAAWAAQKRVSRERFKDADEEQADSGENIESAFIERETLSLLRRELAFISQEYRDILVAFYIDDLKARTIADSLNIPVGTVTSKLTRARKILKEGMNMAREFGIRSYKPEEVKFTIDGDRDPSVPLERPLPKNIILEAHGNPSTLEQLSVEIGVALPYMEDEVNRLVDAELLVEENGKYITNFLIAGKEAQLEIYNAQRRKSKERSALFNQIVSDALPQLREIGVAGCHISDNDFKWTILTIVADEMNGNIEGYMGWPDIFKRKDGGTWGIMGYELHDLIAENLLVSGSMTGGWGMDFFGHRYIYDSYHNFHKNNHVGRHYPGTVPEGKFLADTIKKRRKVNSFTSAEKELWNGLSRNSLFASADDGNIILNFVTFMAGERQKFDAIIKSHPEYDKLKKTYSELFDEVKALLLKHSHARFEETINYYVSDFMEHTTMMVINDAVDAGWITAPENMDNSTVGVRVEIHSHRDTAGLTGRELIENLVGGAFELGEEQLFVGYKDGIAQNDSNFVYWKKLKLSNPLPREYYLTSCGNIYNTETGDAILTAKGYLLIDVGPGQWGRDFYAEAIPGYEEIYGDIKPAQPFLGLEGDALIEKVLGGAFEFGEEKSAENKEKEVFVKWRIIKLSAPPPEYPRTCVGNVMGTEKGDVIFFEDSKSLYIDIGPHPSDPDPKFRSYFAVSVADL